jgi:hypothetical protein
MRQGTCREFILTLDDQSVHTAWLQFVRYARRQAH